MHWSLCRTGRLGRVWVNKLLDWHGVPIPVGRGKAHTVSYADILRDVNDGRDEADLISYASLRVHAKRHYDHAGVVAYWAVQMDKKLRSALGIQRRRKPIEYL